ncbi:hypothetical protein ACF0H5_015080 [Mactra antiquata]
MNIFGIKCYIRNYMTVRSILTMCRFAALVNLVTYLPHSSAECLDADTLKSAALDCFQDYNLYKLNVDHSDYRLFSGIDIEILRAYCTSYTGALQCVSNLVKSCPKSTQIKLEEELNKQKNIQEELTELCTTQRLYELYAQYMSCYTAKGRKTNWCYESKLNKSDHNLHQYPTENFCIRVQETAHCIETAIRQSCGEQAAELVHLLVKSSISGSAYCKYNVMHEMTPSTMKTHDDNSGSNHHNHEHVTSKSHNKSSSAIKHTPGTNLSIIVILNYLFIFNYFSLRVET